MPMDDDKPTVCSNEKKKSQRDRYENRRIHDPRFFDKPNTNKHIKDYAFLYPKKMVKKIYDREERNKLEEELVRKGKKKFFMNKKHLKEIEKDKK